MASVTPAAGEIGPAPHLSGVPTSTPTVPRNPMPAQPESPHIERIGSVRILRPAANWRGIALRLRSDIGAEADERFELALTAGDGRSITIAIADAEEAVALWRCSGRASGLSLLLETPEGGVTEPYPQIGRLMLGPVRIRRRYSLLKDRRPRFLTRRKPGRVGERAAVVATRRLVD